MIALNCEREAWSLFTIERHGREVYSFRNDRSGADLPAGPIASSPFCKAAVPVAE